MQCLIEALFPSLGSQCLIEVHTIAELERMLLLPDVEKAILGINNRDLQTFKVDLVNTKNIMESKAGQQGREGGREREGGPGSLGGGKGPHLRL